MTELLDRLDTLEQQLNNVAESITAEQIFGERGWALMGTLIEDPRLIDRTQILEIIYRSRMASLLSPVIVAGLRVLELLTFGGGVTVKAADENIDEVVQAFWTERTNRNAVTGTKALMQRLKETHVDGSFYWWFHLPQERGGLVKVRALSALDILEVVTNPEDKDEPWYYIRTMTDGNGDMRDVAYPDINYVPMNRPARTEKGVTIDWSKAVHATIVNPVNGVGVPTTLPALAWAKEYERFLEHRATLYAAFATIALVAKAKASRLASIRTGMTANAPESSVKGSFATLGMEDSLEPVRTNGATTSPSEGIQFLEMVVMSFGFPPHLWGKEESGGLGQDGRHKVFFLRIQAEQEQWADDIQDALEFVIYQAVKNKQLSGGRIVRRGNDEHVEWSEGVDPTITISFPELQSKDTSAAMTNLLKATTLDGKTPNGIITPRQFMQLVAPLIELEDLDLELIPEEWDDGSAAEEDFMTALKSVVAPPVPPMADDMEEEEDGDDNTPAN
jgi:hypothetical protein